FRLLHILREARIRHRHRMRRLTRKRLPASTAHRHLPRLRSRHAIVRAAIRAPHQIAHDNSPSAIETYFVSRYSSIPSRPPSRPIPLSLKPPNGACAVEGTPSFTPTIP